MILPESDFCWRFSAVSVAESGEEAVSMLRTSPIGTYQLVLTVLRLSSPHVCCPYSSVCVALLVLSLCRCDISCVRHVQVTRILGTCCGGATRLD